MAITVRSASQNTQAAVAGTSFTIPAPAGVAAGDLLVALTSNAGSTFTGLTSSEFTQTGADSPTTNSANACRVWLRTAGGSEPTDYTFGRGSGLQAIGGIVALIGADTTSPVDAAVSWGNGAAATSQVAPTVDPGNTGSCLVCGWRGSNQAGSYTPPGTMVEQCDTQIGFMALGMATELLAADTATGTRTATHSGAGVVGWNAFSIAIKEAPPPSGTYRFLPFFT